MRNSSLGFLALLSVAGVCACGGSKGNNMMLQPDLSMVVASPDLMTPLNGCNLLLECLFGRNLDGFGGCPADPNKPGKLLESCRKTCLAGATSQAAQLDFEAETGCVAKAFCITAPAGGGAIPCSTTDVTYNPTMDPSAACQACIDAAYAAFENNTTDAGASLQSEYVAACTPASRACMNDTP